MSDLVNSSSRHADGTPERLGRYRLVRPISAGGMAHVFEGRRESLAGVSPRVAIKVIRPEKATDEGFRVLFANEARIGAMLQHQNLVQIQDFDCEDDVYYIVMEFVEGPTVRRAINLCRRNGLAIPLSVIAELGRQVCDGLHYAHSARDDNGQALHLVHRDIKPGNLIINPQGVVKLVDFGVTRALILPEKDGAVRGTWGYMGPEQADGVHVGPGADLFGLASVLFEMAALEPLFPEKDEGTIRGLLHQDEAARRASRLAGPPGRLAGILVRALQRDPAARFPTAAAMSRVLGDLIADPVTAREQIVQFHNTVQGLSQQGVGGASADRLHSSSTFGQPVMSTRPPTGPPSVRSSPSASSRGAAMSAREPAIPVAFGDLDAPRPILDAPPERVEDARAERNNRGGIAWVQVLSVAVLVVAASAVLTFTAWRLVYGDPEPPPVPRPQPTNPMAQLADDVVEADAVDLLAQDVVDVDAIEELLQDPEPSAPPAVQVEPAAQAAPERAHPAAVVAVPEPDIPAPEVPAPDVPAPEPQPSALPPVEPIPADPAPTAAAAESTTVSKEGRGVLTVSSIPRAQVVVDGRFVRYSPLFRFDVDAGTRVITLITDDGRRTTFRVDVPDGGEVRKVYSFETGGFTGE